MQSKTALVTGAGGFIGHHLVSYLKMKGYWVRGVDIKPPAFEPTEADHHDWHCDLRQPHHAQHACMPPPGINGFDEVYALAADMGGMGFIADPARQGSTLYNNTLINFNTLEAARWAHAKRYFFTSSVCVYPVHKLALASVKPLAEEDVYPALPQKTYGWEKLNAEHLVRAYGTSYGMTTRMVRLQNTYGPLGAWRGGREKAPAALCRKVAEAKLSGDHRIEIWGDGKATRTFMYVSDCIRGIHMVMLSAQPDPVTLGPNRVITINELVDMIAWIADIEIEKVYVEGPQGVRGRSFDHSRAYSLGWRSHVGLLAGLKLTYDWVEGEVIARSQV